MILCFIIALVVASAASGATPAQLHSRMRRQVSTLHRDRGTVRFFRHHPRLARTPAGRQALRFARAEIGWTTRELAQTRAALTPRPALPSSLVGAFACIHHGEGAWDANTGNGYYGGLQMDKPFQSRYGSDFVRRWGTADNWPVWAQMTAAARAYESGRGFYPWPNTARACGLI